MSSPYDRYDRGSRRRGAWGHWVPLALTVTVATVGLAAWLWNQRDEEEQEDSEPLPPDLDYENADYGENPPYGATTGDLPEGARSAPALGEAGYDNNTAFSEGASGWSTRVSGALRRSPSPQQFFDSAGKTITAGVAAAGAAMGSALAAIREEDKNAYADHETWSEEADAKRDRPSRSSQKTKDSAGKRRKTVAIVVSADARIDNTDPDDLLEHASILSHIPRHNDFSKIKLFVLIYAPGLKDQSPEAGIAPVSASLNSSYSNIGHEQAETSADGGKSPIQPEPAEDPVYNSIYSQASALVEKESMVLPFTSANGHLHLLRSLDPDVIYLQESLSGDNGAAVTQLQTWLRHDVVLVVGAESGHGGLVDSESEAEKGSETVEKWWHREDRVGRGRGVVVVDGMRVHDDWVRRVLGRE